MDGEPGSIVVLWSVSNTPCEVTPWCGRDTEHLHVGSQIFENLEEYRAVQPDAIVTVLQGAVLPRWTVRHNVHNWELLLLVVDLPLSRSLPADGKGDYRFSVEYESKWDSFYPVQVFEGARVVNRMLVVCKDGRVLFGEEGAEKTQIGWWVDDSPSE